MLTINVVSFAFRKSDSNGKRNSNEQKYNQKHHQYRRGAHYTQKEC